MFKIITPIEKKDGTKYWMRLGTGFANKDDSINMYLDAIPFNPGKETVLQLREMTDEDFRRNSDHAKTNGAFVPPNQSSNQAAPSDALPF
ncbi:MAG TPA: hypothetical protein VGG28_20805 [Kofleriaceae bacterium]|jgi:hypothetical protein